MKQFSLWMALLALAFVSACSDDDGRDGDGDEDGGITLDGGGNRDGGGMMGTDSGGMMGSDSGGGGGRVTCDFPLVDYAAQFVGDTCAPSTQGCVTGCTMAGFPMDQAGFDAAQMCLGFTDAAEPPATSCLGMDTHPGRSVMGQMVDCATCFALQQFWCFAQNGCDMADVQELLCCITAEDGALTPAQMQQCQATSMRINMCAANECVFVTDETFAGCYDDMFMPGDGGVTDAGGADAGASDAGAADAGAVDAGTP